MSKSYKKYPYFSQGKGQDTSFYMNRKIRRNKTATFGSSKGGFKKYSSHYEISGRYYPKTQAVKYWKDYKIIQKEYSLKEYLEKWSKWCKRK